MHILELIEKNDIETIKNTPITLDDLFRLKDRGEYKALAYLRDMDMIKNHELFILSFAAKQSDDSFNPLLKIAQKYPDDNFCIKKESTLYELCEDIHLNFIKKWIDLGGSFDYDMCLQKCFLGDGVAIRLFEFILSNFEVSKQSLIKTTAIMIIHDSGIKNKKTKIPYINQLIKNGLDINTRFENKVISEFKSLASLAFCYDLALFEKFLEMGLEKDVFENENWDFIFDENKFDNRYTQFDEYDYVICDHKIEDAQLQTLEKLKDNGFLNIPPE